MEEKKKEDESVPSLVDMVNAELKAGNLDTTHEHHYVGIATELDNVDKTIDGHAKMLKDSIIPEKEAHPKTPDELYKAILRHVAAEANVENAEKLENLDDLEEKERKKVTDRLNLEYGIQNVNQLKKIIGERADGKYGDETDVYDVLRKIANHRARYLVQKRISDWQSDPEWERQSAEGETHHNFLKVLEEYKSGRASAQKYAAMKQRDEAADYITGTVLPEMYQIKKKKQDLL